MPATHFAESGRLGTARSGNQAKSGFLFDANGAVLSLRTQRKFRIESSPHIGESSR
jgi:hypothetical protein